MTSAIRVGLINDTRNAEHMGCWLVIKNLERLLSEAGIRISWRWPTGKDWRTDKHLSRKGDVDLVLVNAEGSIHSSRVHKLAERFASVAGYFEQHLGVRSVLLNATMHSNEPEILEHLQKFKKIYVRDSATLAELEKGCVPGQQVSDLTLAFEQDELRMQPSGDRIHVTDSAKSGATSELDGLRKRLNADFLPIQFARFPHSHRLAQPRLYFGKVRRWARDRIVHRPSLYRYMRTIAGSRLVIAGRYHAVTMCLLTRTPFLAYESVIPKISWLLQDVFGDNRRVFESIDELESHAATGQWEWTEEECAQIDSYLAACRENNRLMMQEIRTLVS